MKFAVSTSTKALGIRARGHGPGSSNQMSVPRLAGVDEIVVGGLPIACLDIAQTADVMIRLAQGPRRGRPYYFTSANGEVTARCANEAEIKALFDEADLISADGQPLVFASRLFCRRALPERVATTDLFDITAAASERSGATFYLYGATEEANRATYERVSKQFPRLKILGRSHGYLTGADLDSELDKINGLAPDILWIALGVPREQQFVNLYSSRLSNVGLVKTSGGLFDFISGRARRAPRWMQASGFEWLWRVALEPRRLFLRYFVTNPVAVLAMITRSS